MHRKLSEDELPSARELLANIDFLKEVSKEEINAISALIEKQEFPSGQIIILQGEVIPSLYMIMHGKVSVSIKIKGGGRKKIAELGSGKYFGEMSLINSTTASATLKAEEPTLLYAISADNFFGIIQNDISALKKIRDVIIERKKTIDKEKEVK